MSGTKRKKLNDSGTTLIETLAAFTVLAAIMVILFHIVDFSGRLRTQAVDTAHLDQMFWREIFKNDGAVDSSFVSIENYSHETDEHVCNYYLVLDPDRTDIDHNYRRGIDIPNEEEFFKNPPRFRLDNTTVTAYTCIDPLIGEEQLPAPTAIRFRYIAPED